MKKTLLFSLITLIGLFTITGCDSSSSTKLTINSEKMSYDQIVKIYEENEAGYEKNYRFKDVTIEGTVEKVSTSSYYNFYCLSPKTGEEVYTAGVDTYNIFLKDGFIVRVNKNMKSDVDVSSLKKGDKLKISTQLVTIWKTELDDDKVYVNLYAHSNKFVCGVSYEIKGELDEALSGSVIEKLN